MNALAEALLDVARQHMGPAASAFVTSELRAVGQGRDGLDARGLRQIAERARGRSSRFMDEEDANAFAAEVEALASGSVTRARDDDEVPDHQLALDAAASLLARGDHHRAFLAYRDLAKRYHDAPSLQGLGRAAAIVGDTAAATEALLAAALLVVKEGERDRAIAILEEAVALAPTDLASHRRLTALYANSGDVASARCEHTRFAEACLAAGDRARALSEIEYARQTVGDAPALRELVRRIDALSAPAPAPAARPVPHLVVLPPPEPPPGPDAVAMDLIRRRDPGAAAETIAAAQQLVAARKVFAAADLLLAYVASGLPGRDAQQLLIPVVRALGRPDLAVEKCHLLSRLLDLDGDRAGAIRIERLAVAS
ncbi:MAG TPA: hypothetical protein VGA16_07430 [Candidatus Limnocylindria bacterium]